MASALRSLITIALLAGSTYPGMAQPAPRARDLGIPFEMEPGPLNAITDVAGVEVGHVTLIEGDGPLVVGEGPVRTGVTAILPRGRAAGDTVFAWSEVLDKAEMKGRADLGALRIRTFATKDRPCGDFPGPKEKGYEDGVILDLDYWVLMPRR